jgi:hypothetical protein
MNDINEKSMARTGVPAGFRAGASTAKRIFLRLVSATCLALLAGCASVSTSVESVWRDSDRPETALPGKVLVLVLAPQPEVVIVLENEWVHQLETRGIKAAAANLLMTGEEPPDKERVVALVKEGGFDTLLVNRVVDVKPIEREAPTCQVGVVDIKLYDTATEQRFWSARATSFLRNPTQERISELGSERAREFVEALIRSMSVSKVL